MLSENATAKLEAAAFVPVEFVRLREVTEQTLRLAEAMGVDPEGEIPDDLIDQAAARVTCYARTCNALLDAVEILSLDATPDDNGLVDPADLVRQLGAMVRQLSERNDAVATAAAKAAHRARAHAGVLSAAATTLAEVAGLASHKGPIDVMSQTADLVRELRAREKRAEPTDHLADCAIAATTLSNTVINAAERIAEMACAKAAGLHPSPFTLPTSMDRQRAEEINAACLYHSMYAADDEMRPAGDPPDLSKYTLREMLDAADVIRNLDERDEAGHKIIRTVCDPRQLAALFCAVRWTPEPAGKWAHPVAVVGRAAVCVVDVTEKEGADDEQQTD